jgi:hypothetical protein
MKEIKVTFRVPDFYKWEDLAVLIEEGSKETCALVESGIINGKHKSITTDISVEANKDKQEFTFKEVPKKK